jgi:hypothetical protein
LRHGTTSTPASASSWVIIVRIGSLAKREFQFHISVEDFQCSPASREIWLVAIGHAPPRQDPNTTRTNAASRILRSPVRLKFQSA